MKKEIAIYSILFLVNVSTCIAQQIVIFGKVTDEKNNPLDLVSVTVLGSSKGVYTNEKGEYSFSVNTVRPIQISFSRVGYISYSLSIDVLETEKSIRKDVGLKQDIKSFDPVTIIDKRVETTGIIHIDPKTIEVIPSASGGGIEALIKTMPGVASNNELSSQYSVRGGNFDENLVYVNDIEVFRPYLVRSGQQEGLSFINSDMVQSIRFSAGGFEAKYDDKMSSVLDIQYTKPQKFGSVVSASLLGGSAYIEGNTAKGKFTFISGIRYKTSQYILNSLETKGDYRPSFLDFQTYLTYKLSDRLEIALLGNYSGNNYSFVPSDRSTSFGTINQALNLNIHFEGNEIDRYSTYTRALSFDYTPSADLKLKLITSAFSSKEQESFDIYADYLLNELDKNFGSSSFGDTAVNLGYGTFLDHARNYFKANVRTIAHKGYFSPSDHLIQWGIKYQKEVIHDKFNEWEMLDSAGYSIPYSNESKLQLAESVNGENFMNSERFMVFLQDNFSFNLDNTKVFVNAGLRCHYWTYSDQLITSPRFSVSLQPGWSNKITWRLSSGIYFQPPFYRELRDFNGSLVKNPIAQKSTHVVLAQDYDFIGWGRPFRFMTELYYKQLQNIIPYELDNIRLRYYAGQRTKGYVTGLDMKINGEFVEGVESWASLSFMKAMEIISGNKNVYIPRPTDQLINAAIFFQDYIPGNELFKVHLTLFYGSGLPFGPPRKGREFATLRIPSYKRVDIGFSYLLKKERVEKKASKLLSPFKSIWLSTEVFNLLGVNNTVSYLWLTVVPNSINIFSETYAQYAVPNRLSSRRLNLKLILKF